MRREMRRFILCFLVAVMGLFSLNAFADDAGIKIYTNDEYKVLSEGPQLMVVLGVVSDFGTLPFATTSGVTKDVMKKAIKLGATDMYILSQKEKKGDNGWGIKGYQLHITAEAFIFKEPTLENIRAAIHDPKNNASPKATRSAYMLAQKAGYLELADDFYDEMAHGKKNVAKGEMLAGYVRLKGRDAAIPVLKQLVDDPHTSDVLAQIIKHVLETEQ